MPLRLIQILHRTATATSLSRLIRTGQQRTPERPRNEENASNNPATFRKTASPLKRRSLAAKIVRFGAQRGAKVCVPDKPQPRYFPASVRPQGFWNLASYQAADAICSSALSERFPAGASGIWEYHTSPSHTSRRPEQIETIFSKRLSSSPQSARISAQKHDASLWRQQSHARPRATVTSPAPRTVTIPQLRRPQRRHRRTGSATIWRR